MGNDNCLSFKNITKHKFQNSLDNVGGHSKGVKHNYKSSRRRARSKALVVLGRSHVPIA